MYIKQHDHVKHSHPVPIYLETGTAAVQPLLTIEFSRHCLLNRAGVAGYASYHMQDHSCQVQVFK